MGRRAIRIGSSSIRASFKNRQDPGRCLEQQRSGAGFNEDRQNPGWIVRRMLEALMIISLAFPFLCNRFLPNPDFRSRKPSSGFFLSGPGAFSPPSQSVRPGQEFAAA